MSTKSSHVNVVRNVIPQPPVKQPAEIVLTLSEDAAEELFAVIGASSGGDHLFSIYEGLKHKAGLVPDSNAVIANGKGSRYIRKSERTENRS